MEDSELTLLAYYAAVDSGSFETALTKVSPTISFAIALPTGVVRGSGRQEISDYLNGRGDVDRRHVPLRSRIDGDLEFVYGAVVEKGATTTGHFVAAAYIGLDGLIEAYQVAFEPELALLGGGR